LKLTIVIDGRSYEVEVEAVGPASGPESQSGARATVQSSVLATYSKPGSSSDIDEAKLCRSPLAGVVARLHSSPGQQVQNNELLLVLDAMKMEIKITAQSAGTIKSIEVAPGDAVKPSQVLVYFE
jgi:methylmalonyl-CoA carboxyltransferase small subunit